jgi:hypothetical protein
MKPPFTLILLLAAVMTLTGCAIPIPPSGPDLGKYGFVRVGVTYEPNALTTPYLSFTNNTNSFK